MLRHYLWRDYFGELTLKGLNATSESLLTDMMKSKPMFSLNAHEHTSSDKEKQNVLNKRTKILIVSLRPWNVCTFLIIYDLFIMIYAHL